jgi:Metallo-beta-lactamase superfamily
MATHRIAIDLAKVVEADKKTLVTVLAWGHPVTVVDDSDPDWVGIRMREGTRFVRRRTRTGNHDVLARFADLKLLKIDFADVQQGDGTLIETPSGKLIIIDGGQTHMFARYAAARLAPTSAGRRRKVDAIVVTHGDADHFEGLTEIFTSETRERLPDAKRLFIRPQRVFHNGLVKGPEKLKSAIFGATKKVGRTTFYTELADDLRTVDDARMNDKFQGWKRALEGWTGNGAITVRRLARGMDDAFSFLGADDPQVEVLGPITTPVDGTPALPKLGDAAHTINGHSIVLRMTFGKWRLLFAGDLNEQTEEILATDGTELESELFKVPHHGSHEFTPAFVEKVAPLVSVISAGDDRTAFDYIHPRATLLGALGQLGRPGAVIFITELVAFFESIGVTQREEDEQDEHFFGFRRAAFGIVRVRMSADRMLVYTDSGKPDMKEAYVFAWRDGKPVRLPDSAVIKT